MMYTKQGEFWFDESDEMPSARELAEGEIRYCEKRLAEARKVLRKLIQDETTKQIWSKQ